MTGAEIIAGWVAARNERDRLKEQRDAAWRAGCPSFVEIGNRYYEAANRAATPGRKIDPWPWPKERKCP